VKPFVSPVTDKTEQYTITRTPGIRTTLMYEKQKTVPGYGKRVLTDKVCYTNVKPGKEYTVEGTLMDKDTRKPLMDAQGKKVTASKTLTPKEANGCVDVEFEVDASLFAGKTTVAFEKLLHEGKEVAV
ncbi:VaFE repeat-containing surface-anchored protein, partial [Actinotignum urinale]